MQIVSRLYAFCETYFIRIWTFCFVLVYMRIPLAHSLQLFSLRRILIILPIFLSLFLIFLALIRNKTFRTTWLTKLTILNLIVCGLYSFYLIHDLGYGITAHLLPTLGPVMLCFLPLLAIEQYRVDIREFFILFRNISIAVIWVGFFWFAVQGLSRIEADRLGEMLIPLKAQLEVYPNSTVFSHRRIGFLMRLEPSALAMMAGIVFLYGSLLLSGISEKKEKAFYIATIIIGLFGIFYSSSLTMLGATVGLLLTLTFMAKKKNRLRIVLISGAVLVTSLLVFKSVLCSFLPRIVYYLENLQKYSSRFFLRLDCNFSAFLMRFEAPDTLNNKCIANEVLYFDSLSNYGLLPVLAWYCMAFLTTFVFFRVLFRRQTKLIPLAFFAFSFLIPTWHMSGVEGWGNNYVYVLAIYCLLHMSQRSPENAVELRQ
jgi:hypothetical protein